MQISKGTVFAVTFLLLSACVHNDSTKADSDSKDKSATSKKEDAADKNKKSAKDDKPSDGQIIGTPAAGSKFSKLKLGMSMEEAFAKIGTPDRRWTHPTAKAHIPFYFGPDRWVTQCAYNREGTLTFNNGGSQALTLIEVNKSEGKK